MEVVEVLEFMEVEVDVGMEVEWGGGGKNGGYGQQ